MGSHQSHIILVNMLGHHTSAHVRQVKLHHDAQRESTQHNWVRTASTHHLACPWSPSRCHDTLQGLIILGHQYTSAQIRPLILYAQCAQRTEGHAIESIRSPGPHRLSQAPPGAQCTHWHFIMSVSKSLSCLISPSA